MTESFAFAPHSAQCECSVTLQVSVLVMMNHAEDGKRPKDEPRIRKGMENRNADLLFAFCK